MIGKLAHRVNYLFQFIALSLGSALAQGEGGKADYLVKFRDHAAEILYKSFPVESFNGFSHFKQLFHIHAHPAVVNRFQLQYRNQIEFVEPVRKIFVLDGSTLAHSSAAKGWSGPSIFSALGINAAWETTRGRQEMLVGILGTGVDLAHPELRERLWHTTDKVNPIHGYAMLGSEPVDNHAFGTHAAGLVIGRGIKVQGIAPEVTVMALQVLDGQGHGTTLALLSALDFGLSRGVRIFANTWGLCSKSPGLQLAVDAIGAAGGLFVIGTGYLGPDPGCTPVAQDLHGDHVVSVLPTAAGNQSLRGPVQVNADLTAPGFGILSAEPGRAWGVKSGAGTAVAIVAGAASLLWSTKPDMGAAEVRQTLITSATRRMVHAGNAIAHLQRAFGSTFDSKAIMVHREESKKWFQDAHQLTLYLSGPYDMLAKIDRVTYDFQRGPRRELRTSTSPGSFSVKIRTDLPGQKIPISLHLKDGKTEQILSM